jgi:hypothetical protein
MIQAGLNARLSMGCWSRKLHYRSGVRANKPLGM